ncbi:MAG: hypothetical protein IKR54_03025 [Lachnospiraceae bacterium]|nr:hypothetical protein [Lachnospiraceae bacterium]
MTDKARIRAGKRTKKNKTPLVVALCTLLVLAAVVAGFVFAGGLIQDAQSPAAGSKETDEPATGADIPEYDSELIYGVSPETGIINSLVLCRLDSKKGSLKLSLIDPAMSYSMSGSLYSELSTLNIRLPQDGRFGGLLGYCSGDSGLDAGRRIAEEMLAVEIDHYSSFDSRVLGEYISVSGKEGEKELTVKLSPSDAKGAKYGTAGTMMGFVKEFFGKALASDRTVDDRLVYLEVFDALGDGDITTQSVPVTVHNETMELDVSGWNKLRKG